MEMTPHFVYTLNVQPREVMLSKEKECEYVKNTEVIINQLTYWLTEPEGSILHKSSLIIPILIKMNSFPLIVTYLCKIYSYVVLASTPRPS